METKGLSKDKYSLQYVSGVCIGVGKEDRKIKGYCEMICNSILPETDKEYAKQKKQIIRDMQIIADAFNKLQP